MDYRIVPLLVITLACIITTCAIVLTAMLLMAKFFVFPAGVPDRYVTYFYRLRRHLSAVQVFLTPAVLAAHCYRAKIGLAPFVFAIMFFVVPYVLFAYYVLPRLTNGINSDAR